MPYRSRRGSKTTSRRGRRRGGRSASVRKIREIARRAVIKEAEPKRQMITAGTGLATSAAWQDVNTALSVVPFNSCATGDGSGNRDGMQVYATGVKIHMQLTSAADRPQACRILILEKLSDYTSSDLPSTINGCFPRNDEGSKYKVRFDKIYNLTPRVDDSGTSLFRAVYPRVWIPLKRKQRFHGASSSDLDKGELRMWVISDNLAGGTDWIDIAHLEHCFYFKDV